MCLFVCVYNFRYVTPEIMVVCLFISVYTVGEMLLKLP